MVMKQCLSPQSGGAKFFLVIALFAVLLFGFVGFRTVSSYLQKNNPTQPLSYSAKNVLGAILPAALPLTSDEPLKGESSGRINILLLGIGGEGHSGKFLTDTIMLVSFSPTTHNSQIFSIPRDLAVRAPGSNTFTKINALYALDNPPFPKAGGVDYIEQKITQITGLPVDYYAVIDFGALVNIINDVGGISIPQESTLVDNRFPTTVGGYQTFGVQSGWRYLNGDDALKYVRTRESDNDFQRMRRQHVVLIALEQKIKGLNAAKDLPTILKVYQDASSHTATDANLANLERIFSLTSGFSNGNAIFYELTSEPGNLLISRTVSWGGQQAYILQPKAGTENYSDIQKFIQEKIQG